MQAQNPTGAYVPQLPRRSTGSRSRDEGGNLSERYAPRYQVWSNSLRQASCNQVAGESLLRIDYRPLLSESMSGIQLAGDGSEMSGIQISGDGSTTPMSGIETAGDAGDYQSPVQQSIVSDIRITLDAMGSGAGAPQPTLSGAGAPQPTLSTNSRNSNNSHPLPVHALSHTLRASSHAFETQAPPDYIFQAPRAISDSVTQLFDYTCKYVRSHGFGSRNSNNSHPLPVDALSHTLRSSAHAFQTQAPPEITPQAPRGQGIEGSDHAPRTGSIRESALEKKIKENEAVLPRCSTDDGAPTNPG